MDRVFSTLDIVGKIVDEDNAAKMSVVSRTGRDAVRDAELRGIKEMVEYIFEGEMLSNFPVRWPIRLCDQLISQNGASALRVFLFETRSLRHAMHFFVHKDQMGATLGVKLRVISSETYDEDGHGWSFHVHSLIKTKRALIKIIESGCWHPYFNDAHNPRLDIAILEDATVENLETKERLWSNLIGFIQNCAFDRQTLVLRSFQCAVLENKIFIKFLNREWQGNSKRWIAHTACLTQGNDGITMAITSNQKLTMIFSGIKSLGRFVCLLYNTSYWVIRKESHEPMSISPEWSGTPRITSDPAERPVHVFRSFQFGLTGCECDLEYLLQYIYDYEDKEKDSMLNHLFVNDSYRFCLEYVRYEPMVRISAFLLWKKTPDNHKEFAEGDENNPEFYRHNVQLLLRRSEEDENEEDDFIGVELYVISSNLKQEDWQGRTFHVRSLIESKDSLVKILESGCWHPSFTGEQDPALSIEISRRVFPSPFNPRGDLESSWRNIYFFMHTCYADRKFLDPKITWFTCNFYDFLIGFHFRVNGSTLNHSGQIAKRGNGVSMEIEIKTGERTKKVRCWDGICSVGRIIHIFATEFPI